MNRMTNDEAPPYENPDAPIGPASITIRPGYADDHSPLEVLAALDSSRDPAVPDAARRGRRTPASGSLAARRIGDRRPFLPTVHLVELLQYHAAATLAGTGQAPQLPPQLRVDSSSLAGRHRAASILHLLGGLGLIDRDQWRQRSERQRTKRPTPSPARRWRRSFAAHNAKTLLRFVMCGSVDDGKSTLIGRLLYESRSLFVDQLAALEADSKAAGTQGDDLDFALLLDGLAAEREQGITIDVAYRHFSTDRRHFIVADAPGHEQYTRNMVTGASTADSAVILVDARKGVLTQTRRHSQLVALLGVRDVALAINKMDLVDYSEDRYREIEEEYRTFASQIGLERITCIPVSALRGDNVLVRSDVMPWYHGPTLMGYLETVEVDRAAPVAAVPDAGAMGQPPQPRLPRLSRARSPAARSAPAIRSSIAPSGIADPGRANRDLRRRSRPRRRRAVGHADAADEIDVTRGDVIAHSDRAPRRGRSVRGHGRVDGRQADAPRAQLPDADRRQDRHRDDRAAQAQAPDRVARARGRDQARAERDRRRATSSAASRSPSTRTGRTATPAASS